MERLAPVVFDEQCDDGGWQYAISRTGPPRERLRRLLNAGRRETGTRRAAQNPISALGPVASSPICPAKCSDLPRWFRKC